MSGVGQTEKSRRVQCTSGLPPRADLARHAGQVREGPEADMGRTIYGLVACPYQVRRIGSQIIDINLGRSGGSASSQPERPINPKKETGRNRCSVSFATFTRKARR
jgi:hypothetical protein